MQHYKCFKLPMRPIIKQFPEFIFKMLTFDSIMLNLIVRKILSETLNNYQGFQHGKSTIWSDFP